MQDMTGYVQADTIWPPSDEQLDLTISTAHTENDYYVKNSGLRSPAEFILGDTPEGVISEDSYMFDNVTCKKIRSETNKCQPESPIKRNLCNYMHLDQTKTTNIGGEEERNLVSQKPSFFSRSKIKMADTVQCEEPKYRALIGSEEPLIKEDPDLLYYTQNKIDVSLGAKMYTKVDVNISDVFNSEKLSTNKDMEDMRFANDFKDMGVAEEVVVVTEEEEKLKTNLNSISLWESMPSDPEDDLDISEEEPINEDDVTFQKGSYSELETVMSDWLNFDKMEDDLYAQLADSYYSSLQTPSDSLEGHSISPISDLFIDSTNSLKSTDLPSNPSDEATAHDPIKRRRSSSQMTSRPIPPLTLDIGAARNAFPIDYGMSDTPELLKELKPEIGKFDLIDFIINDPNNNPISSPVESCHRIGLETPRRGKSRVSLLDLKQAQKQDRSKILGAGEKNEPSTSGTSGRPARESAARFNKMIEEGLLSSVEDSHSVSSDDEDEAPLAKRRRTSTTSCRRRLNSDSDRSSVSEDAMKYRERRDRNNESSKRSRQKRKMHHLLKQKELKELEERNSTLRHKVGRLESMLARIKVAWADYIAHTKDNDKDRGDEHY